MSFASSIIKDKRTIGILANQTKLLSSEPHLSDHDTSIHQDNFQPEHMTHASLFSIEHARTLSA